MAVREGYKHADTPHAKTVMAPGWTYGCHSSKTGDKPRGGPATYMVLDGFVKTGLAKSGYGLHDTATVLQISRPHTTHWLDTNPDGTPLKCGHEAKARIKDAQCIGCANAGIHRLAGFSASPG